MLAEKVCRVFFFAFMLIPCFLINVVTATPISIDGNVTITNDGATIGDTSYTLAEIKSRGFYIYSGATVAWQATATGNVAGDVTVALGATLDVTGILSFYSNAGVIATIAGTVNITGGGRITVLDQNLVDIHLNITTGTVNVTGDGSQLVILDKLTIGSGGNINVSSGGELWMNDSVFTGTIDSGGTLTAGEDGYCYLDRGSLTLNGSLTVSGGHVVVGASGALTVGSSATVTVTEGGAFDVLSEGSLSFEALGGGGLLTIASPDLRFSGMRQRELFRNFEFSFSVDGDSYFAIGSGAVLDFTTVNRDNFSTIKTDYAPVIPLLVDGDEISSSGAFTILQTSSGCIIDEDCHVSLPIGSTFSNPAAPSEILIRTGGTLTVDSGAIPSNITVTTQGTGRLVYRSTASPAIRTFSTSGVIEPEAGAQLSEGFVVAGNGTVVDVRGVSFALVTGSILVGTNAGLQLDVDQVSLLKKDALYVAQDGFISISATAGNSVLRLVAQSIWNDGVIALDPALLPAGLDFNSLTNAALGLKGKGIIVPLIKNDFEIDGVSPLYPHMWNRGFVIDVGARVTIKTNLIISDVKARIIVNNGAQVFIPHDVVFQCRCRIINNGLIAHAGTMLLSLGAIPLLGSGIVALALDSRVNGHIPQKGFYSKTKLMFGGAFLGDIVPLLQDTQIVGKNFALRDINAGFVVAPAATSTLKYGATLPQGHKIIVMKQGLLKIPSAYKLTNNGTIENFGIIDGVVVGIGALANLGE